MYINGAQSEFLAGFDYTPGAEDAILYRIDFDPEADDEDRLIIRNHRLSRDGQPQFLGRMEDGDNSGSSPAVSLNEKWIFTADNAGRFYCFSADDGSIVWQQEVGTVLGSATVAQRIENDGRFYVYSMGNSNLWVFGVNPSTGAMETMQNINFNDYLLTNYWRTDKPGYGRTFPNWSRHATASSRVVSTILCKIVLNNIFENRQIVTHFPYTI